MVKKFTILLYAAVITTLIAGILHINKFIDFISNDEQNGNADILFLIGGAAPVFWLVPIIRQRGKIWYSIGITGTTPSILFWVITRILENSITGRAGPISEEALTIQLFQIAFIILSGIILVKSSKVKNSYLIYRYT
ncbi:MAG TPA: hypothetical protein VHJ38_01870 [Nitrososphaeraceae archaeon]|nr:hypothetical protein [Nitrososphaeraceae archaeon]